MDGIISLADLVILYIHTHGLNVMCSFVKDYYNLRRFHNELHFHANLFGVPHLFEVVAIRLTEIRLEHLACLDDYTTLMKAYSPG